MDTSSLKLNRLLLLSAAVLLLLTSCKKEPEPVAIDEQPRILSMSLPGILPENISIDHLAHTITVRLPSSLPALEMVPSFTVSQQTSVYGDWSTGKKTVSLAYYCPCTYDEQGQVGLFKAIEPVRVDNLVRTSYYTLILKGNGAPVRIKPLQIPVVYEVITNNKPLYSPLSIPVENYYGSSFVQYIAVTKAGSLSPNWIGPGSSCMENCAGRLNEIVLSLTGYLVGPYENPSSSLKPGLHDLDLWLADGTKLHAKDYILVK